jgi:hypothetical protein
VRSAADLGAIQRAKLSVAHGSARFSRAGLPGNTYVLSCPKFHDVGRSSVHIDVNSPAGGVICPDAVPSLRAVSSGNLLAKDMRGFVQIAAFTAQWARSPRGNSTREVNSHE